jgi:HSP90 family molecular chaperone
LFSSSKTRAFKPKKNKTVNIENNFKVQHPFLEIVRDVEKKKLLDWVKDELGSLKVSEIRPIFEQSEHPFIITAQNHSAMRHILRVSQPKESEHLASIKPILHVNFNHPVTKGLIKLHRKDEKLAKEIVEQVYDNALVTAGLMRDVSTFVPRLVVL